MLWRDPDPVKKITWNSSKHMGKPLDDDIRRKLDRMATISVRVAGLVMGAGLLGLGIWGSLYSFLQWHLYGSRVWGAGRILILSLLSIYLGCLILSYLKKQANSSDRL